MSGDRFAAIRDREVAAFVKRGSPASPVCGLCGAPIFGTQSFGKIVMLYGWEKVVHPDCWELHNAPAPAPWPSRGELGS